MEGAAEGDEALAGYGKPDRSPRHAISARDRCGATVSARSVVAVRDLPPSKQTTAATFVTPTRARRRASSACFCPAVLLSVLVLALSPPCCQGSSTRVPAATATSVLAPKHDNLWDTISTDPDYSRLTACLEMADPSVADLLRAASGTTTGQPLTLFAPKDSAFDQPAWRGGARNATIFEDRCQDEQSATELVSYHVSWSTSATPYIGEEFRTLLGIQFSPRYYGLPKSRDVPEEYFPIQFVDSANVTAAPIVVGGPTAAAAAAAVAMEGEKPSYLYPVDRVLRIPAGTIWQTLCSDPSFSLLVEALNATSLAQTLNSKGGTERYTLFAPDNEAIEASEDFPEDPAALEVLLSFHALASGAYPMSLSGAHFSQQLFKVDPSSGSLSRDYYREFYTDSFEDGQVTSIAGPLLNVTRAAATRSFCVASSLEQDRHEQDHHHHHDQHDESQEEGLPAAPSRHPPLPLPLSSLAAPRPGVMLMIDGVPISEPDITATNGVIHRLSSTVMAPPDTVAGVLMDPPFPLSAAGGGEEGGNGFEALGELVQLAWPLVKSTLTEEGPLTILAPTDAAFDLAIAAGALPPRPWYNGSSPFPPSSSSTTSLSSVSSLSAPVAEAEAEGAVTTAAAVPYPSSLTPEAAARVLLSHTLQPPEGQPGPLLFSPTARDPFASGFRDGDRFATARTDWGGEVEVGVRVLEVGTRSPVAGTEDGVADREVFVDGARVTQCVDGAGFGHDCGSKPRPSNTYALNGAHLCAVHAVDRVMFPSGPDTDLAAMLDGDPSLSRFSALLRENDLLPLYAHSPSSRDRDPGPTASTGGGSAETAHGGGGASWGGGQDGERRHEGLGTTFTTIFAPTNAALNRLERQRPWLFKNSTAAASAAAGGGDGGREADRGSGEWSPIRELLAYHLVPDAALFSRYLNESSPPTKTLALGGTAPVAATFSPNPASSSLGIPPTVPAVVAAAAASAESAGSAGESRGPSAGGRTGPGTGTGTGTLHVNLGSCASTDRSASDGVLHVLAFDATVVGEGAGAGAGAGAGVLVPDALELTYAYGFRETYKAIVASSSPAVAAAAGGADEDQDVAKSTSVAKALRGRAAHTLLAVADGDGDSGGGGMRPTQPEGEVSPPSSGRATGGGGDGGGAVGDSLRYQTLVGDQTFHPAPAASRGSSSSSSSPSPTGPVAFKTLLAGADVHLFNNSENVGNPFFTTVAAANTTGINLNQAEVLSADGGGMVALNGRIHEISEPLSAPAPHIFSLLASHPQLSGWADWVELTGLAELLSDPKAGPFTVFAPVDSSLELVPGLSTVASDKASLAKLVRFHVTLGTLAASTTTTTSSGAVTQAAAGVTTPRSAAGRLFTPSLANATAEQRSALSGERFASGPRLWTLLDSDHERDADGGKVPTTISVQIAAAAPPAPEGLAGNDGGGGGIRVFLGPGGGHRQQVGGVDLFLGAFASDVVLPDLNAVNGVVHGISGVMTYPDYKKPTPRRYGR